MVLNADKKLANSPKGFSTKKSEEPNGGDQIAQLQTDLSAHKKLNHFSALANAGKSATQLMALEHMANASFSKAETKNQMTAASGNLFEAPTQLKGIEDEELVQGKFEGDAAQLASSTDEKPNNTGLPSNLKIGVEKLSGVSMDDVKVSYNSNKPAQLSAHAYAQGSEIHLASGQEKHLPHEAWHVVQQKQGRVQPTMQMKGKVNVNDDARLEKEADVMGAKALRSNNLVLNSKVNESSHGKFNHSAAQLMTNSDSPIQFNPYDSGELNEVEQTIYQECIAKFKKYQGVFYRKSTRIERASKKILPRYRANEDVVRQAYWDIYSEEIPDDELSLIGHEEEIDTTDTDIESFGAVALDGGEDGDSITLGKDGFKMTIAGKELTLSRSKLKAHTEQSAEIKTPELDLSVNFPVPIGPLAPLALNLSLGFAASASLGLKLEGDLSLESGDENRLDIKGTGEVKAEVEANAGVGLGVSVGIASVIGELQAAIAAAVSGTVVVNASIQENAGMINGGAAAVLKLNGDLTAALKGAVKISMAFFSKEFGLTFKEWKLGAADYTKEIASIGDANAFIPSKADLGITDKEQAIINIVKPKPTPNQERWVKMLLKDFNNAKAAAELLREKGIAVEDPNFWDIIDARLDDDQMHYKIHERRLVRCTEGEAMPLMVSNQLEQAINMLK